MLDKKEVKRLMKYAKKILDRRVFKKLKKVGEEDKIGAIHYAIKSKLDHDYEELKQDEIKLKKQKKDVFFAETRLNLLNSKIKLFVATFHKKDFTNMRKMFGQIEKELRNV
jgi:hypothetical protein